MKTSVVGTHYPGGTFRVFLPPLKMTPRNSMSSREWEIENWWSKTSFQNNLLTWIFYKPIVLLLSEFTSNRRTAAWGLEGITPLFLLQRQWQCLKKKSILITKMHLSVKEKQTHRYREHTCGAHGEVGEEVGWIDSLGFADANYYTKHGWTTRSYCITQGIISNSVSHSVHIQLFVTPWSVVH